MVKNYTYYWLFIFLIKIRDSMGVLCQKLVLKILAL